MKKTFKISCPECYDRNLLQELSVKFSKCTFCNGYGYLKYERLTGKQIIKNK